MSRTGEPRSASRATQRFTVALIVGTTLLGGCLDSGGGGGGDAARVSAASPPSNSTADQPIPPGQAPAAQPTSAGDAARFLEQTSFGATSDGVSAVMQKGAPLALEEQFYKGMSGYPQYFWTDQDYAVTCPDGAPSTCWRDNFTPFPMQVQFFRNAVAGGDQLRQRVAFALGQIVVVSGNRIYSTYGLQRYHQMLMNRAFGNYRDILADITLSPAMGEYLNMVNSPKPNAAAGVSPNENYARELLQLFSIGKVKLNTDGTPQLDASGNTIPTYDQEVIVNLARVFTGWTYPTLPGGTRKFYNPRNYEGPMELVANQHDTGAKTILDGRIIAAGQSGTKDLNDALDIIFNHPNVGPFIGKQLIQHLVTANPSPQYVARVTAAFNNNGSGVRGDMKAVLRAIILDAEARGPAKTDPTYGKLREPALLAAGVVRALGGRSDGVYLAQQAEAMGQDVFNAPSVFNFYSPDFKAPGTTLLGPAFKIMLTGTILARSNFVNEVVYSNNGIPADTSVGDAYGTQLNLASLQAQAGNPDQLLDTLSALLLHGTMSTDMRNIIKTAVSSIAASDTLGRVRTAVYLIATSSQYQVNQ